MTTAYAGTATYHATIPLPTDGEERNATLLNGALQKIIDRGAYLKQVPDGGNIELLSGASLTFGAGAFLAGSPEFTGTPTFSGAVEFSGGGSFVGGPTFSGGAEFSGDITFSGNPSMTGASIWDIDTFSVLADVTLTLGGKNKVFFVRGTATGSAAPTWTLPSGDFDGQTVRISTHHASYGLNVAGTFISDSSPISLSTYTTGSARWSADFVWSSDYSAWLRVSGEVA